MASSPLSRKAERCQALRRDRPRNPRDETDMVNPVMAAIPCGLRPDPLWRLVHARGEVPRVRTARVRGHRFIYLGDAMRVAGALDGPELLRPRGGEPW